MEVTVLGVNPAFPRPVWSMILPKTHEQPLNMHQQAPAAMVSRFGTAVKLFLVAYKAT